MKRGILILFCLCTLLAGGKTAKGGKELYLTTRPQKIGLFVNQNTDPYTIPVDYTFSVPKELIPRKGRLIYMPRFVAGNHQYLLQPVIINGSHYRQGDDKPAILQLTATQLPAIRQISSNNRDLQIHIKDTIPFELWMVEAQLQAFIVLQDRHKQYTAVQPLSEGVVYMPEGPGPVRVRYEKEKKAVEKTYNTDFFYPEGGFTFNRDYRDNARHMQQMMQLIDSLQQDTSLHLQKIVITGSSSPLGSLQANSRLAEKRALELKQRLVEKAHLDDGIIGTETSGENWDELLRLVRQSEIPGKATIIRIIESGENAATKESQLRQLPGYPELQKQLFPWLRKVNCRFYYTREEEIIRIIPL